MIQQVIFFQSWQEFRVLIEKNMVLPFINNHFDCFTSTFSTTSIVKNFTKNISINMENNNLSTLFPLCYCPTNDIDKFTFFSDLRRLNFKNHHVAIMICLSKQETKELHFILTTIQSLVKNYTVLVMIKCVDMVEATDFKKIYKDLDHSVIAFHANCDREWMHILSYQLADHRLICNKVQLSEHAEPLQQHIIALPTYLSVRAASSSFINVHHYLPFEQPHELSDRLLNHQQAVVVLAINHISELDAIAQSALTLKKRFGRAVKILLKERKPCIRYHDFHMLINAGVQAVIEYGKTEGQLYDQITLAYRTEMPSLDTNLSALKHQYQTSVKEQGEFKFNQFKTVVKNIVTELEGTQVEFALIELIPFSSIALAHAAQYCKPGRQGDIYCQADGRLLLFFSSLRRAETAQALNNSFNVRSDELFTQQTIMTDKGTIFAALDKINHVEHRADYQEATPLDPAEAPHRYAQKIPWDEL